MAANAESFLPGEKANINFSAKHSFPIQELKGVVAHVQTPGRVGFVVTDMNTFDKGHPGGGGTYIMFFF